MNFFGPKFLSLLHQRMFIIIMTLLAEYGATLVYSALFQIRLWAGACWTKCAHLSFVWQFWFRYQPNKYVGLISLLHSLSISLLNMIYVSFMSKSIIHWVISKSWESELSFFDVFWLILWNSLVLSYLLLISFYKYTFYKGHKSV